MIRKVVNLFLFVLCWSTMSFGEQLGIIKEVLLPAMMKVYENECYIAQDHQIFVYSLPDVTLQRVIGKSGQGPGEFNLDPSRSVVFSINDPFILAESRSKIIFFRHDGSMIKELKKRPTILQTRDLGNQYAVLDIHYGEKGESYFKVSVLDEKMNEITELYRQPFFTFGNTVYVMPDSLNFCTIGNKVWVEQSPDGYKISVFDVSGKPEKVIKKDSPNWEVLEGHRKQAFEDFCLIPSIQRVKEEQGEGAVKEMLSQSKLVYPDNFPAIQHMTCDRDFVYIQTSKPLRNKTEFQRYSKEGEFIDAFEVPNVDKLPFLSRLQGDKKRYAFWDQMYYYLKRIDDGVDDEHWELHREALPKPGKEG